jgi:hypothetical protein
MDPAEPTEASEPTERAEPHDSADPTDAADSAEPIERHESTDQADRDDLTLITFAMRVTALSNAALGRGEVRKDLDVEAAVELIFGAYRAHCMKTGPRAATGRKESSPPFGQRSPQRDRLAATACAPR